MYKRMNVRLYKQTYNTMEAKNKKKPRFDVEGIKSLMLNQASERQQEKGIEEVLSGKQDAILLGGEQQIAKDSEEKSIDKPEPKKTPVKKAHEEIEPKVDNKKDVKPNLVELPIGDKVGINVSVPREVYNKMIMYKMRHPFASNGKRVSYQTMVLTGFLEWMKKHGDE